MKSIRIYDYDSSDLQNSSPDAPCKLSDKEIWSLFKKGDHSAFVKIYTLHFNSLFKFGSQFTLDRNLIKDTIQDLFINLNATKERLGDVRNIKLYLYQALKRRIIKHLSRATTQVPLNIDGHDFKLDPSIEHIILNQQNSEHQKRVLKFALDKLTKHQREAIYYFYYENYNYKEVKELLNLGSIKAARNLIYRAISVLRTHF